ncbi:transcriptional regulator, BadM/Rrf2 family [Paracoccus aminovorans]|uniref:Transcriptional regulator, BadM/Rrf2 family n=1 Tax=Paracoccus aminovorans TaxID=34004 RepID=A0A1I3AE46_9RHOB|nr:Rrf2 family transcriptional regulator [Paracoccus aminovorans]CQR84193.1 transcriptional regulator [Paracoccus aminovorans]SFH48096.1 transcriptional regulator, BadM/Rrf2 family [Paracoccus aminovorans]
MRLATFTDYGLRVLMRLAGTPEKAVSTGQIATEFAISQHHLAKVVSDLGLGGFVRSVRGRTGGLRLMRPAQEITVGQVVRHLERRFSLVECFRADGGECVLGPGCRLKPQLAAAREAFMAELDRTTIADCAWPGRNPDGRVATDG